MAYNRGEKQTRKVNLFMEPSLYERVFAEAAKEDRSVNDMIRQILRRYLDGQEARTGA